MSDPRFRLLQVLEEYDNTDWDAEQVEYLVGDIAGKGLTIVETSDTVFLNRQVAQWCYDQIKEVQQGYLYTVAEALKRAIDG